MGCLVLFAGCTFSYEAPNIARYGGGAPPKAPISLALGVVKFTQPSLTRSNAVELERAFDKGVEETTRTNLVHFIAQATNLPPEGLILSGTITQMKQSGGIAGVLVAVVGERWRMVGSFQVRNAKGVVLTEFTGEYKLAAEGAAFGVGVDRGIMTSWKGMATGLGQGVGEQLDDWLNQKSARRQRGA
jgi:hypothetical protein